MNRPYPLWGFNDPLKGNEGHMLLSLPAIALNGEIWIARERDWNPALEATGRRLTPQRASEVLTPLAYQRLTIQPGEWIVLVGGAYRDALEQLGLLEQLVATSPLMAFQNDFSLGVARPAAWKLCAHEIIQHARTRYLDALRVGMVEPSAEARAAYLAMVGTGLFTGEDAATLQLAHALWTHNATRARNVLRMAEVRFKLDPKHVQRRAFTLLQSVHMNQKQPDRPKTSGSSACQNLYAPTFRDTLDAAAT